MTQTKLSHLHFSTGKTFVKVHHPLQTKCVFQYSSVVFGKALSCHLP